MGAYTIETERLLIIPMSYSLMCSVLENRYDGLDAIGVKRNVGWPRQDTIDILSFLKDNLPDSDNVSGFDVWMIVKKESMTVIGDAGFKGAPDENGAIDIGFGLIEAEWGKGYGYESANALINWAFSQNNVKKVTADCLLNNHGSTGVLRKCKMRETGRDNESIHWEISAQ